MDNNNLLSYVKAIKNLPEKSKYSYTDLLIKDLFIEKENNLSIYYAPFDYINKNAKIIIIGITPGFTQMEIAIKNTRNSLLAGITVENIMKNIKETAAFAGVMRRNLIEMLDTLKLNEYLNINSCNQLFEKNNLHLTHMTSIIRYPVFNNGKDYTGHSPEILKSKLLKKYIDKTLLEEIKSIKCSIIIPLGNSVSKILEYISKDYYNINDICLFEFPHPSGANGHRKRIFEEKKKEYKNKIKNIFV
jgi:hypothetical protein